MRLFHWCFSVALVVFTFSSSTIRAEEYVQEKIPVIFDTDIGNDIDDMWELALLLRSPEFDVQLITTDMGKGIYRAKLIAKFLEIANRTDIPIGIGHGEQEGNGNQQEWVEDYDLESYPGTVHEDGAQAIIDVVNRTLEPVTIIAVGPVPNLAEAFRRDPGIASKAYFVGMHGAVHKGYAGSEEITPEWNVVADTAACQVVLSASWQKTTITPLDTCGLVLLQGGKFARVRNSDDPLIKALIENYNLWADKSEWFKEEKVHKHERSSTLFDTVAVYLAMTDELCKMETLPIRITDKGMTVIDPTAQKMRVATQWKDLGAFEDWLVDRLTGTENKVKAIDSVSD